MFKLEIKTGGAAFRDESIEDSNGDYRLDDTGAEVRRILNEISIKLRNGYCCGKVIDINGNCVGEWNYE